MVGEPMTGEIGKITIGAISQEETLTHTGEVEL